MKGMSSLFLFGGVLIIGILILVVVTTSGIIPGVNVAEVIESATLAYTIAGHADALNDASIDNGHVDIYLLRTKDIKVFREEGKTYVEVDGRRAPTLTNLETGSVENSTIIRLLKTNDGVEIVSL